MSYEKTTIADVTSAIPTQSAPIMREEAVYDPYSARSLPKTAIGQPAKIVETPVEESKPAEATVKLSPAAAAIARKEQRFRAQQLALAEERKALDAEKAEIAQFKAMKEKLAAKDYSGLEGLVDYNEYSQYQVNKLSGSDPVQEKLQELDNKIDEFDKNNKDMVKRQFEAAVNERKIATKQLVEKSAELPRLKKMGQAGIEAVVHHILETWEHDKDADGNPVELSVEQAAKEVDQALLEKAKKWTELLEEEKAAAEVDEKKQLPPLKSGLKTLTNQVTAGEVKRPTRSLYHMSDAERWAEARKRAEEKLQQQGR